MNKKFIYVFVRKDLPNSQKIVQASHAILEISRNYLNRWEEHPSVVVVGANSEHQLKNYSKKVKDKGFRVIEFFEPLFKSELTSFAVEPLFEDNKIHFKSFNLIRESAFLGPKQKIQKSKEKKDLVKVSPLRYRMTISSLRA